jgi:predicted nucleic acid-binding protein
MPPLLLDASVWVAAAQARETHHASAFAVTRSEAVLAALDLTLLEVANAIGVKCADPHRAARTCDALVARCDERIVRVGPELVVRLLGLAAQHGLTAYDAAYVAVAQQNGWTLVSTDIRDLVSRGLAVTPDAAV